MCVCVVVVWFFAFAAFVMFCVEFEACFKGVRRILNGSGMCINLVPVGGMSFLGTLLKNIGCIRGLYWGCLARP